MTTFIATLCLFATTALGISESPVIATNATAREYIATCREMLPKEVEISGRIILRNRRGIVQKEHNYRLMRVASATKLWVDDKEFATPTRDEFTKSLFGTDVTWSDLTLDYLNWKQIEFDSNRESETVHGQVCTVILLKDGVRAVRVWIDRKTGALMQAEEIANDRATRRLWGTRIKKFGERWAPNVLEVETLGSGHRTKITVEELK